MTRYLVDVPDHRAQAFEVHLKHDGWADQITPVRPHPVLDLPVESEYTPGLLTIRDYLIRLLSDLWKDGEGFNGKRPFGYSGWESDLILPLVRAGLIPGTLDADGLYLETCDDKAGEELIAATIKYLGEAR